METPASKSIDKNALIWKSPLALVGVYGGLK